MKKGILLEEKDSRFLFYDFRMSISVHPDTDTTIRTKTAIVVTRDIKNHGRPLS